MTVKIKPSEVNGSVTAPPSKSMAHRLLICAALAEGKSRIDNIAYSSDIIATLDCLSKMGARVEKGEDYVVIDGISSSVPHSGIFDCCESASTMRFLIPLAMLSEEKSLFTGCGSLLTRPMDIYEKIAEEKGLFYNRTEEGTTVGGVLQAGKYTVCSDVSSQFVSGLIFALPLCEGDSEVVLVGETVSCSYIDMTILAMKKYGVSVCRKDDSTLCIKGGQKYTSRDSYVEGDYSNAAFFDAMNYIGGSVKVDGLTADTLQGDRVYREYFSLLEKGTPILDIRNCPDLAPIIMTLAAVLNGARLVGTGRLKIKESNRGVVMKKELDKFGADIKVNEDEIIINKSILTSSGATLSGHNDHRVVMALSVLCSRYGGKIEGAEAVRKSFPDFFARMKKLGIDIEYCTYNA